MYFANHSTLDQDTQLGENEHQSPAMVSKKNLTEAELQERRQARAAIEQAQAEEAPENYDI